MLRSLTVPKQSYGACVDMFAVEVRASRRLMRSIVSSIAFLFSLSSVVSPSSFSSSVLESLMARASRCEADPYRDLLDSSLLFFASREISIIVLLSSFGGRGGLVRSG